MALYRRGGMWWYEFTFAGKRVRESAKTPRKTLAAEAQKSRRLELERAYAGLPAEEAVKRVQSVADMLKACRNAYPVNHRPKSVEWVRRADDARRAFVGNILLPSMTEDRIREYMSSELRSVSATERLTWSCCAFLAPSVAHGVSSGLKSRNWKNRTVSGGRFLEMKNGGFWTLLSRTNRS